jgi:hypothetical protein
MAGYLERIKKLEQSKKEKMMEVKLTYTVEAIGRPYGASESIPWGDAKRHEGLTERKAIKCYNDYWHWYHPDSNSYSGHVRIVGTDDWTYEVEPPTPGERSTLVPVYHLDDL